MPEGSSSLEAVKAKLTPWREIIFYGNQVLLWEKPFFPGVIAGVTTLLYLILYCMDMSNLTLVPLLLAFALGAEFCVPFIAPKIFDSSRWSSAQEQEFDKICVCISETQAELSSLCGSFCETKENSPKLFAVSAITILVFLSYLGSIMNGFFAAWALTLVVLMLPGLKKKGALDKVTELIMSKTKKQ